MHSEAEYDIISKKMDEFESHQKQIPNEKQQHFP